MALKEHLRGLLRSVVVHPRMVEDPRFAQGKVAVCVLLQPCLHAKGHTMALLVPAASRTTHRHTIQLAFCAL